MLVHGAMKMICFSLLNADWTCLFISYFRTEEEKQSLRVGTAELLEMCMAQEPDSDFTFCLGSDTFFDLTEWKWRRSKDVLKLLQGRIVVLNRRGVQRHSPESLQERVDKVNLTENAQVILLEVTSLEAISSSLVRSCQDEAQVEEIVAAGVLGYIKEHRLYGFSSDTTEDNSEKQRTRDI
jgi:nicotinic acid mononucleotide adenylyltransferase